MPDIPERFEVVSKFTDGKHYVNGPWDSLPDDTSVDRDSISNDGIAFDSFSDAAVAASRLNIIIKKGGI